MSLALTLMPYYGPNTNFSHTLLPVNRNYENFDAIMEVPALDVDDGFNSFLSWNDDCEAQHYGETLETPYGERLQWTHAKHLKPLITDGPVGAFVQALDDLDRVALYWQ